MVNGCLVLDCTSEWYPNCGVRFHAFPTDLNRRNQWLNVVPLKRPLNQNGRICSLHFECSDYTKKGKRLKTVAIPILHKSEADGDTAKNPAGKTQILEILLREKSGENKKLLEIYESAKRSIKEPAITPSYVSVEHDYYLQTPNFAKPPENNLIEVKSEPIEINVPGYPNEEIMGNPDEFKDTNSHIRISSTYEHGCTPILGKYLNKKISEDHDRRSLMIQSKKLRDTVEKLERTVIRLKKQIKANKIRDSKMKIVLEKVRNYINNSEIDNILNGRFKDLCKLTRKGNKRSDYSPDVIKFAASLYSISPKAYNFVMKHVDLPRTKSIRKYESQGTFVVKLDKD